MLGGTLRCPICGRPYKWYAHIVADQTACPRCVAEAERAAYRPDTEAERQRRQRYWGGW